MSPLWVPGLGRPIAEDGARFAAPADQPAFGEWLTLASRCFTTAQNLAGMGTAAGVNGSWYAANCPLAFPFILDEAVTVYQLGWVNGGTITPINIDIGVYDDSWVRKVSAGSTANSGPSTWQFVNVADTLLPRGKYYLVMCASATTANNINVFNNIGGQNALALLGAQDSATTAFPLPDPLTNMAQAATATNMPQMAMAIRALI